MPMHGFEGGERTSVMFVTEANSKISSFFGLCSSRSPPTTTAPWAAPLTPSPSAHSGVRSNPS